MLFLGNNPEVVKYINALHATFREKYPTKKITHKGLTWLAFCITGIIATGCLNWQSFQRNSAGTWKARALSRMIHKCPINWDNLFQCSVKLIFKIFEVKSVHLSLDDFDRHRSKRTKKIHGAHKTRNKNGGGFVNSQNIVLLIIVTKWLTLPVGFSFYEPDPKRKAWRKNDLLLKIAGKKKKERPEEPSFDKNYPTKIQAAARLIRRFKYFHNSIKVRSITADGLYLNKKLRNECRRIYPKTQFISRLRNNQNLLVKNKSISVKSFFKVL